MFCNQSRVRPYFNDSHLNASDKGDLSLGENATLNRHIHRYLKDYQIDGIRFLYNAYVQNRGAILADEMGLGKTIQVIGFLASLLNKTGLESDLDKTKLNCIKKQLNIKAEQKVNPFLVICPASVIDNWMNELNVWGYFAVSKFITSNKNDTVNKLKNNRCEIVISSLEMARKQTDLLQMFEWSAIIVDEFHKLKNNESITTKAFQTFNTKTRIGLSGTILQNNLIELWSLLNWVNPNCLGSKKSFRLNYCRPILAGQRQNATKDQLLAKIERTKILNKLKKKWILRRTKQIIANQLPNKEDQVVYCRLSDFQIDLMNKLMKIEEFNYLMERNEPCECGKRYIKKECLCNEELEAQASKLILSFLSIFLKICNHPALLVEGFQVQDMNGYFLKAEPEVSKRIDEFYNIQNCGKMNVLKSMLEYFHGKKSKVLLFSYSIKLLDIIEKFVNTKNYNYLRLDGTTKTSSRVKIVDEFNKNENIFLFLISTKAGGVGLNMTGANVVILFDPNWNPTHDTQAQDRAYRIGQKRDVHVYRLISSGCIEENIYLRQIYKTHLSKEIVENEDSKRLFYLSKDSKSGEFLGIKNLFALNDDHENCKTKNILKRYTKIEKGVAGLNVSKFVETSEDKQKSQLTDDLNQDSDDDDDEEFIYDENDLVDQASESEEEYANELKNEKHFDSKIISDDEDSSNPFDGQREDEFSIRNILNENDIVHVHMNKDLIKPSKIETHIRECVEEENKTTKINPNENAFRCNILPHLSTLDYIDLDQDEFNISSNVLGDKQHKFILKDGTCVVYGKISNDIRQDQFRQMAKMLKCSLNELADLILSLSREERFARMKQFYTKVYPESIEFYQNFSKYKRRSVNSDNEDHVENETKKTKTNNPLDFYENLQSFESMLDLIHDDEQNRLKLSEKNSSNHFQSANEENINDLYKKFMGQTSTTTNSSPNKVEIQEIKKNPTECKNEITTTDNNDKDKYDLLLDELFD